VGPTEYLFHLENHHKLPLLTLYEDIILHIFAVDCSHSHGGILACGASARQDAWPQKDFPPTPKARYAYRVHPIALQFFCMPLDNGGCSVTLQIEIDDMGAPEWLLQFLLPSVFGRIFSAMNVAAQAITTSPHASEHAQAIADDPHFYGDWLPRKIAACKAYRQKSQPCAADGMVAIVEKREAPAVPLPEEANTVRCVDVRRVFARSLACCLPRDQLIKKTS